VLGVVFQDNVDLGDLMLSLCYLPTAGRLTITMIKARNLKAMDITGASGNSEADRVYNYRLSLECSMEKNEYLPVVFLSLLQIRM